MHDARRFTDRHGFTWQVCELVATPADRAPVAPADAAPYGEGELYFFARGTTLVLRHYPRGWAELSARDLERLREGARVLGSDTTIRLAWRSPRGEAPGSVALR